MDPNTALNDLRDAIARIGRADCAGVPPKHNDAVDALVAFETLDAWLSTGGFLPAAWARGRND